MKPTFTYKKEWHYLFSDGVVRKAECMYSSGLWKYFRMKPTDLAYAFADNGFAPGTSKAVPHIVLCLEDTTTWRWKKDAGESFTIVIVVGDTKFNIFFSAYCYTLYINGKAYRHEERSLFVDVSIIIDAMLTTLKLKDDKTAKLKAEYEQLMRQAQSIQKQIGEL